MDTPARRRRRRRKSERESGRRLGKQSCRLGVIKGSLCRTSVGGGGIPVWGEERPLAGSLGQGKPSKPLKLPGIWFKTRLWGGFPQVCTSRWRSGSEVWLREDGEEESKGLGVVLGGEEEDGPK